MSITKKQVYHLIEEEIEYQNSKLGQAQDQYRVADYLVAMQAHFNDAILALGKGNYDLVALGQFRKIVAVGVCAIEKFGAPPRTSK